MIANKLARELQKYHFVHYCFKEYCDYLLAQVNKSKYDSYDLLFYLLESFNGDEEAIKRLLALERLLPKSQSILKLSKQDFKSKFGFRNDLLSTDPEKLHDVLAEPLLVLDLSSNGFISIEKLSSKGPTRSADFKANHKGLNYAIELKTMRTESGARKGRLLGDSKKPAWWIETFFNACKTKIEYANGKVFEQLDNTCKNHDCVRKMIVFYNRKLGPSTLMNNADCVKILKKVKAEYPNIDYFGAKSYFGDIAIYPDIP